MKKIIFFFIVIASISCNSSGSSSSSSDSATQTKAVQNVNGNIPDSTNSGPINGSRSDSLQVDSSHMRK